MACSLALLGHRSTDSTRDNKTPPMMPATLVMAGSNNSAQHTTDLLQGAELRQLISGIPLEKQVMLNS